MVKINQKKAAVELSLNLIIMLIIGMVVLGLVIGFVNSLVNKGTESFDKQLGDNEKLKLDEVRACADNLCVNPSPSLSLKLGTKTNMFIKVRAFGENPIVCGPGDLNNGGCEVIYEVIDNDGPRENVLILAGPGFNAKDGGEDAQMYSLSATGDEATIGTYYLTIKNYAGTDNEVTKTITVEIN